MAASDRSVPPAHTLSFALSSTLIAVVGDAEAADESVQVTDVAAGFRGSVKTADLIDLVRDAHENRMRHVTWEPAS